MLLIASMDIHQDSNFEGKYNVIQGKVFRPYTVGYIVISFKVTFVIATSSSLWFLGTFVDNVHHTLSMFVGDTHRQLPAVCVSCNALH